MSINLSHYIGKNVKVSYASGKEAIGVITLRKSLPSQSCSYRLVDKNQHRISDHCVSGRCYYFTKISDIVKIEPITPEKTMDKLNPETYYWSYSLCGFRRGTTGDLSIG